MIWKLWAVGRSEREKKLLLFGHVDASPVLSQTRKVDQIMRTLMNTSRRRDKNRSGDLITSTIRTQILRRRMEA